MLNKKWVQFKSSRVIHRLSPIAVLVLSPALLGSPAVPVSIIENDILAQLNLSEQLAQENCVEIQQQDPAQNTLSSGAILPMTSTANALGLAAISAPGTAPGKTEWGFQANTHLLPNPHPQADPIDKNAPGFWDVQNGKPLPKIANGIFESPMMMARANFSAPNFVEYVSSVFTNFYDFKPDVLTGAPASEWLPLPLPAEREPGSSWESDGELETQVAKEIGFST